MVPSALPCQAADRASAEQVKKEAAEAVAAITAYASDRRDEAIAKARSEIQRLDRHLERLEDRVDARWDRLDRASRERLQTTLKTLRKQRNEVAEWRGRMRESSAGAWEHAKEGFVTSYRSMADAFAKAVDEFR